MMKLFGSRRAAFGWCLLATSLTSVCARSVFEALQSVPELSNVYDRINASPVLTELLSSADNFTFLAPTNNALSNSPNSSQDVFEATIRYSLLHGGYPALSFTEAPKFANSNLGNTSFTNNTAGQAVQLVLNDGGDAQVISGNQTISKLIETDILCTGGIVHTVDTLLSVPVPIVQEITSQKLEFFVSILNTGGFLSSDNAGFVTAVQAVSDATYFIPNSQKALDNFGKLEQKSKSFDELKGLFEYHVVSGSVVFSDRLKDGLSMKTQQGENITIHVQNGVTYVNAVKIMQSNYIVANGVVHVLDDLLDPSNTAGPAKPTSSSTSTTPTSSSTTPSPSSASVTSSPAPSSTPTSSSSSSNKLKLGLGIGLGVGLSGLLLLALIIYILRQRKARREREAALAASGGWEGQSETTATPTPNEKGVAGASAGLFARRTGAGRGNGMGGESGEAGAGSGGLGEGAQGGGVQPMRLGGIEAFDSSKSGPRTYSVNAQGPSIPPRSPGRLSRGHEFF